MLRTLRQLDWGILGATALLVFLGLMLIYSATWGDTAGLGMEPRRQALFAALGFLGLLVVIFFPARWFKDAASFLYLISLGLLVAVSFWGETIRGARSWFVIGAYHLQPSELAKLALIWLLAKYLSEVPGRRGWAQIIRSGIYAAIPVAIIIWQNDTGTALLFIGIWLGMLVLAGIPFKHILVLISVCLVVGVLSWNFVLQDYQKDRIRVFLDPSRDQQGIGYNVAQAKIAIGSGGWFGKGLGQGSQSQLKFLPEQHTDFIFSVLAEELGFAGCAVFLGLLIFLLGRMWRAITLGGNLFGRYGVGGVAVLFTIQALFNISANLGLLPVAGIPLPLVSYGGSSLLTTLLGVGFCLGQIRNFREQHFQGLDTDVFGTATS